MPICSHCKKIRNQDGSWEGLEEYFEKQAVAEFSHGVCPDCLEKYYKS
ncbi:MAG TPA: hypothetical protein PLC54_03255 [Spirochaetales bacterium]|nr:hypothetical protein [Spirochaetales bacterium]